MTKTTVYTIIEFSNQNWSSVMTSRVTQFATSYCSQQSRDVLDTSHKDERSHILGFVGDSPAHKDTLYGTGCVLAPPPPPRSCLAVTRTLPGGQVQTTLGGEDSRQVSACCWAKTVDRSSSTTAIDEGYSSRPPSYVVCAGAGSSAPVRRGDVTPGSAAAVAASTSGHTIYAVRRAAVCCAGDYSCCHTQRRHHHHLLYHQPQQQQQQLAYSGRNDDIDDRDPDREADQLTDDVHPVVCQSSAGDDVMTSGMS